MRWSPARLAAATVLGAWAGTFWFVLFSGRTPLYLSTRTEWVVPVGGSILTLAAVGRLLSARTPHPEPLRRGPAWSLAVVALPVVALLALPPASPGSFAASRRSVSAGFVSAGSDRIEGEVTLVDVAGAIWSKEAARALLERAGSRVSFVGIVTRSDGTPADEFVLSRFLVSCCVADALSVQVRVVGAPPGEFQDDQWVRVDGTMYPLGREVVVRASEVREVPRPKEPYLNV